MTGGTTTARGSTMMGGTMMVMGAGTTKATGDATMAMGRMVTGGTTMASGGSTTQHDKGNV